MCGRFVLSSEKDQVADHYALAEAPAFNSGYNIAPSSYIPVIRNHRGRELALCHWGFIPHWAKDTKLKPINAKAESISEKPYFRDAFRQRRCLIPANGYYEWRVVDGSKQPYFIHTTGSALFSLAGIWSYWQGPDTIIESCAIITTAANQYLAGIHGRMPVIIKPDSYDAWLNEGGKDLLRPYAGDMDAYPVGVQVNNPRHQGEALIQPLS